MPDFGRRHYVAIAEILGKHTKGKTQRALVEAFSEYFSVDNHLFDRDRFEKAIKEAGK